MKYLLALLLSGGIFIPIQAIGPLPYAAPPNDEYWLQLWHLENVSTNGVQIGPDLNVRSAWPISQGEGVTIAIVDDGVDLSHPDMAARNVPSLNWNFEGDVNRGDHPTATDAHGTSVAGLAIAELNNRRGISGVAPQAQFASWVIFNTNGTIINTNGMGRVFDFHTDEVEVQNHSWVYIPSRRTPTAMPVNVNAAISNAVHHGRGGKGVVIVRAAGNDRRRQTSNGILPSRNVNEDAFTSDHRAITVGAVNYSGAVASYSTPGAAVLAVVPSGDLAADEPNLFTTDRVGTAGKNVVTFPSDPDLNDYLFGGFGFGGTSAAAPQMSGVAALILSVNPELTYRDVQQITLHSAKHSWPGDPDLSTNAAGFRISHNIGYGLVDAGVAVELATRWPSRPALTQSVASIEETRPIPDGGLQVHVQTPGGELKNYYALPSFGVHIPDTGGTRSLPLVFVENPFEPLAADLRGKAVLIRYQTAQEPSAPVPYRQMLESVAKAGAEFAILYRMAEGNSVRLLSDTLDTRIPAVGVSQNIGEAIRLTLEENPGTEARVALDAVTYSLSIPDSPLPGQSLLAEHVLVHVRYAHPFRGDLRMTLRSPRGTESVLYSFSDNPTGFTNHWTFMTARHFYENASGTWEVRIGDEAQGSAGQVESVAVQVLGVPILDLDRDGLDDLWEVASLGSINSGAADDPDLDGYSNIREQILQTNPVVNEKEFAIGVGLFNREILRLNWPAREGVEYEVLAGRNVAEPLTVITNLPGVFPQTVWFGPSSSDHRFFEVRAK